MVHTFNGFNPAAYAVVEVDSEARDECTKRERVSEGRELSCLAIHSPDLVQRNNNLYQTTTVLSSTMKQEDTCAAVFRLVPTAPYRVELWNPERSCDERVQIVCATLL